MQWWYLNYLNINFDFVVIVPRIQFVNFKFVKIVVFESQT